MTISQYITNSAKATAKQITEEIHDYEYYNGKKDLSIKLQMYINDFAELFIDEFEEEEENINDHVEKYRVELVNLLHKKLDKNFIITTEIEDNTLWMDVTYK